jgi:hypothetical protein
LLFEAIGQTRRSIGLLPRRRPSGCDTRLVTRSFSRTDHPVRGAAEDLLDREGLAQLVAGEVRALDASRGAVVGLLGPWGIGKTSLLNMIREKLTEDPPVPVTEFNPWLFSSTEQLVTSFFEEVAAELRMKRGRVAALADDFEAYGDAVSPLRFIPVVGPWIDRLGSGSAALGRLITRRTKDRRSVGAMRERLGARLAELKQPIVVVIDDIDRLSSPEIREVFKLVRLTANFPNVIYLLAFDRVRVETALAEDGTDGRVYLEKILQVSYEVPIAPTEVLHRLFLVELQEALADIPDSRFDPAAWPDIYVECIRPLITNMRDAKRYVSSVPLTARQLADRIALADVLAAEALRVFLPKTYALLPETAPALTTTRDSGFGRTNRDDDRERLDRFVASAGELSHVARAFCERLFPATRSHFGGSSYGSDWLKSWLKHRRLAHPDVLAFYLDRVPPAALESAERAERAFALLGDEPALRAHFEALAPDAIEETIASLEAFENDYDAATVEIAVRVILEQLPKLRTESRGMFDVEPDLVVSRVALRLFRRVENEADRLAITHSAFDRLTTLHGKFVLLQLVGHSEGAGFKLIGKEDADALESALREQVATAEVAALAAERDLLRLLWWSTHADDGQPTPTVDVSAPELRTALLVAALTEVRSQTMGTRAVRREERLAWDALTEVLGGEDPVRQTVEYVHATGTDDARLASAVDLAERYLAGWRPKEFRES